MCRAAKGDPPVLNLANTWHRYVLRFQDLLGVTQGTGADSDFDLKKQMRVDLLQGRIGPQPGAPKFWITGIELLKETELPPPADM